jgi:hypothetical protein
MQIREPCPDSLLGKEKEELHLWGIKGRLKDNSRHTMKK